MNISLALSGGGFRAMVFHLGVLARLSWENRMQDVRNLSSVSGGSLCAASSAASTICIGQPSLPDAQEMREDAQEPDRKSGNRM